MRQINLHQFVDGTVQIALNM